MYVYVKEEGLRRRRKGSRRGKVRVMEMKERKSGKGGDNKANPNVLSAEDAQISVSPGSQLHQTCDSKCMLTILT